MLPVSIHSAHMENSEKQHHKKVRTQHLFECQGSKAAVVHLKILSRPHPFLHTKAASSGGCWGFGKQYLGCGSICLRQAST